jgi:hypothetical protein
MIRKHLDVLIHSRAHYPFLPRFGRILTADHPGFTQISRHWNSGILLIWPEKPFTIEMDQVIRRVSDPALFFT